MKYRQLVVDAMDRLRQLGQTPLFPNLELNPESEDSAQTIQEKNKFAWDHFKAIEESEAVYFILPAGYMGTSCKLELGYALALKKKIYFSELTDDIGLDGYITKIIALDKLEEFNQE